VVQSMADVEALAREQESLAGDLRRGGKGSSGTDGDEMDHEGSYIDALAISHEFTDHCHKETLLQAGKDVPVFTIKVAAKIINGWDHFRNVVIIPDFAGTANSDWGSTSVPPLPDWIGISRLLPKKQELVALHSALIITFNNQHHSRGTKSARTSGATYAIPGRHEVEPLENDEDIAEALIHTPHGISSVDLADILASADPPIRPLALLHGLNDVKVGKTRIGTALQINLGARNGWRAQQATKAKYWFGTHDEVKQGSGIIARMLKTKQTTLREALELERKQGTLSVEEAGRILGVYEELGSGESRVLV
jgi:hypothetical protein